MDNAVCRKRLIGRRAAWESKRGRGEFTIGHVRHVWHPEIGDYLVLGDKDTGGYMADVKVGDIEDLLAGKTCRQAASSDDCKVRLVDNERDTTMEWTKDDLDTLLVGHEISIVRRVPGDEERWTLKVSQVTMAGHDGYAFVWDADRREGTLIDMKDMDDLLAGKAITSYGKHGETATMLPTKAGKPAGPRLTAKWERRWWQVYFHYYTTDNGDTCSPDDIAALADEAIGTAMKHLEGK